MGKFEDATTEELVDELEARYDHILVGLIQNKTKELDTRFCRWSGNRMLLAGFAGHFQRVILVDLAEDSVEEREF